MAHACAWDSEHIQLFPLPQARNNPCVFWDWVGWACVGSGWKTEIDLRNEQVKTFFVPKI